MSAIESLELFVPIRINLQDIDIIASRSIDACLHWCYDIRPVYSEGAVATEISEGGLLLYFGMDNNIYKLDLKKLLNGLKNALPYLFSGFVERTIIREILDDDVDFIIQLALFDKVIYD